MTSLITAIMIIVIFAALVAYLLGILLKIYFKRKYAKSSKDNNISSSEKKNQSVRTSVSIEEKQNENSESLYTAILGEKNRDYYLVKFYEFDHQERRRKTSWNWGAFFGGGLWALYRKMYGYFFALWGIWIIAGLFEKADYSVLSFFLFLGPWIAFTILANSLYYGSIKKKIVIAQLSIGDKTKLLGFLRHKGGVHTWVIWVCCLLSIIVILLAIAIPQMAHTFIKP